MPKGVSGEREQEYQELKQQFKKEGRYKGREKEVAARIVNKQRAQYGETRAERQKDKQGKSPDRNLPIRDYQEKTIDELAPKLNSLSIKELEQVKRYEKNHKDRKGMMEQINRALQDK